MKKTLIVSGLVLSTLSFGQSAFNKTSIDLGVGLNKSFARNVNTGLATNINIPHLELGVRQMFNNRFGIKADFGFDQYKSKSDADSMHEFQSNYLRFNLQGIVSLTNILDFGQFSKKVGFFAHAGPGIVFATAKKYYPNSSTDHMGNFIMGLTAQVKLSSKVSLNGDISVIGHILQDRSLDGRTKLKAENGFDGATGNVSLGFSFYLGDKAEHADWTPTKYTDEEAMAALKAKIEKAEKDMMDDDKDGVPNYLDQEPGTAPGANVDTKGKTVKKEKVVDMDGDGVLDVNDFCPTIKGTAAANGCPDQDGDGLYDFVDKCPTQAGSAADGGCPVIKAPVKELMTKAMKGVQFETGKATLLKKSLPILDQVAKVMIDNPSYNLAIDGHTDNVGDPGANLKLSDDRARSVKAYLMSKGVPENKMKATGYGDTKPKAPNTTAKGKAENRRVEFIISFESIK